MSEDVYKVKDDEVEKLIKKLDLTAPRITQEHIEHCVKDVVFLVVPRTTVTICCLTLQNGFNIIGHSACASPENFDEKLGRTIAYRDAKDQIGKFEGYLLKEALYRDKN